MITINQLTKVVGLGLLLTSLTVLNAEAGDNSSLLKKLVKKGVITQAEAAALLETRTEENNDKSPNWVSSLTLEEDLLLRFHHTHDGEPSDGATPDVPAWLQKLSMKADSRVALNQEQEKSRNQGWLAQGKFLLNMRYRYEYADERAKNVSHANTLRTRLGYQTPTVGGFQALAELEDVRIIGNEDNYNQSGGIGPADRTVIADVKNTELNRGWLSYTPQEGTLFKVGRQLIALDKGRFLGSVGWRQNEQTHDAISLTTVPWEDTTLFYSYIDRVNRIFSNEHPDGNFDSQSHLINLSYSGLSAGKLTTYAYLLDFGNSLPNSTHTYGGSFTGTKPATEEIELNYHAEFAWQTDAGDSPLDYNTEYYHLALGGTYKQFTLTGGYEVLGTDNDVGFKTPLATLHAFNGFADAFLTTPGDGLHDIYIKADLKLPWDWKLGLAWHDFESDGNGANLGQEWDAVLSRKIDKNWTFLIKAATYDGGDSSYADRDKVWAVIQYVY
jgi:hypothetical protein